MDDWVSKQCTLMNVAKEKQLQSDFHAMVEYDPTVTEYPVHSYVLFTPPVGRSDKLLRTIPSNRKDDLYLRNRRSSQAYPQPETLQL